MSNTRFYVKVYVNKQKVLQSRPVDTTMMALGHQISNLATQIQMEFENRKDTIFGQLSTNSIKNARPSLTVELYTNDQVFLLCTIDRIKLDNVGIEIALTCEKIQAGIEDIVFNWDHEKFESIDKHQKVTTDRYTATGAEIAPGSDFRSLNDEDRS